MMCVYLHVKCSIEIDPQSTNLGKKILKIANLPSIRNYFMLYGIYYTSFCTYVITVQLMVLVYIGRYWEMVQRLKITHFYTAPTAIRMLIKKGDEWVKKYDRSSLRILGCGQINNYYI